MGGELVQAPGSPAGRCVDVVHGSWVGVSVLLEDKSNTISLSLVWCSLVSVQTSNTNPCVIENEARRMISDRISRTIYQPLIVFLEGLHIVLY